MDHIHEHGGGSGQPMLPVGQLFECLMSFMRELKLVLADRIRPEWLTALARAGA